eukprot:CAMPEP_0182852412 /NCGR_PEP_ID=MMETSP0034_2-20130328/145_1 /TAXON_ID=156128 /ORGANISM="Nephroselmis pyriformis, Strain CCMP717" /LENGTH=98 /DNA_ID=CAMNT_0024983117 /DNA_START=1840 /DNA_END=2133 /DNA_ORIENTATION=-
MADSSGPPVPTTESDALSVLYAWAESCDNLRSVIDDMVAAGRNDENTPDNLKRKAMYGPLAKMAGAAGKGNRMNLGEPVTAAVRVLFPGTGEYMGFRE